MTRNEFLEDVEDFADLISFCNDNECPVCEDVVDEDYLDDYICEDIRGFLNELTWTEIRDYLNDISTGYLYYVATGTLQYAPLDEYNFEDYKQEALEWGDRNDIWDEDEHCMEEPEAFQDPPAEEEDFSAIDLITMCNSELLTISQFVERRTCTQHRQL